MGAVESLYFIYCCGAIEGAGPGRYPPGHVRPVESLVNWTVMLGMLEILHKYNNLSDGDSLPTATTSLGSLAETPILSDCVTYGLPALSTQFQL